MKYKTSLNWLDAYSSFSPFDEMLTLCVSVYMYNAKR